MFSNIEEAIMELFKNQKEKKLVVNYNAFRREAKKIYATAKDSIMLKNFICTNKWIIGVSMRNNVTPTKVTRQM